jgi:tetratricopeptide (TPR) repeat protein
MGNNKDLESEMLDSENEMNLNEKLTSAEKIQRFIEKNGKKIMIISLIVIVAATGFYFLKNKYDKDAAENREMAGASLSVAMQFYNANEYEKALSGDPTAMIRDRKVIGLVEIAKKYKGTDQGYQAAFYAGNCYLSLQKATEAKEQFKAALESTSKLVLEGANAGMGAALEFENNFKEAVECYKKASTYSLAFASKSRYNFFEGLCYEKLNEKENAIKIYKEIINESRSESIAQGKPASMDNNNEFVRQAKAGLVRLGTIID